MSHAKSPGGTSGFGTLTVTEFKEKRGKKAHFYFCIWFMFLSQSLAGRVNSPMFHKITHICLMVGTCFTPAEYEEFVRPQAPFCHFYSLHLPNSKFGIRTTNFQKSL